MPGMPFSHSARPVGRRGLCALGVVLLWAAALRADPAAEEAAARLLAEAHKAYQEKNYPLATARYRELLTRYATSARVPAARFRLARALHAGPAAYPQA